MRIDLHVRSSEATQTNRSTGSDGSGKGKSPAVDKGAVQAAKLDFRPTRRGFRNWNAPPRMFPTCDRSELSLSKPQSRKAAISHLPSR
jgi:hypothetical protein